MTFAVITGASSGIGLELARICRAEGHEVLIVADESQIVSAAAELDAEGIEADLATAAGAQAVVQAIAGRPVDLLCLNAGTGLGDGFLEQDIAGIERIVLTNIMGTLRLFHPLARDMRSRGQGRILITGSIVGFMPGPFQAVYNATKSFLNGFSVALAEELKDTGVTVTCLMPGATETKFFARAGMLDTPLGQMKKEDPAKVARAGYDAAMSGRLQVTPGIHNKIQATAAEILPAGVVAKVHRRLSEPQDDQ